jgi:hypothetical protein
MALAEDVARWAWYKGRFEEIFGDRSDGRFVESSGRPYPAAVLDRLLAYVVAHQGVWIATANEVASLALL